MLPGIIDLSAGPRPAPDVHPRRRQLLAREKEFTRQRDALNAERPACPGLFEGRGQLLIYHFMFDPDWDEGCCPARSWPTTSATSPICMLETPLWPWSAARRSSRSSRSGSGWAGPFRGIPAFGSDFNYDFHVTLDQAVAPVEYNYRTLPRSDRSGKDGPVRCTGRWHLQLVTGRFCAQDESARNAGGTPGCGTADGAARRTRGTRTGSPPAPAGRGVPASSLRGSG